jgi:hypothetical protein
MAWVGMVCAAWLLLFRLSGFGGAALKQAYLLDRAPDAAADAGRPFRHPARFWMQLKEAALPKDVMQSLFRDRFATWHGVSSAVYLVQSLLGLALVAKQNSR